MAQNTPNLKWEEPPPGITSSDRWETIAMQLRQSPGKWALIEEERSETVVNTANRIAHGRVKAFRHGRWEAVSRSGKLYVRFLGEDGE